MDERTQKFDPTQVLVMVLAGGEGKRLYPLTLDRAKPAVPFGGRYRIIDIVLSNFVNSGVSRIKVLTQYKSASLEEHIARNWRLATILDQFTADACQRPVLAGPVEATALGNLLVQVRASGELASLAETRQVLRTSTEVKTFLPGPAAPWEEAAARFEAAQC